MIVRSNK